MLIVFGNEKKLNGAAIALIIGNQKCTSYLPEHDVLSRGIGANVHLCLSYTLHTAGYRMLITSLIQSESCVETVQGGTFGCECMHVRRRDQEYGGLLLCFSLVACSCLRLVSHPIVLLEISERLAGSSHVSSEGGDMDDLCLLVLSFMLWDG